ncbi:MAG: viperin family antiviral radical SAM protein [Euryarchaeota archaeon]|nr:viperin family antiviral radical SAM protein [Euryarchaeota archaeon]
MIRENRILVTGRDEIIGSSTFERASREDEENYFSCLNHVGAIHQFAFSRLPWVERESESPIEIKSANWHVTMNCNYRCKFCFYKNMTGEFRNLERAKHILETLKSKGIEKINFAGGEPLLYKDLNYLLKMAKDLGFTVSIVTNASLLDENKIRQFSSYVDWIGVSVDSADEDIEKELGRGGGNHVAHIRNVCEMIRRMGIRLKINTTVTKMNFSENMTQFISSLCPDRWKVFQMLHMKYQNDDALYLVPTKEDFDEFRSINGGLILDDGSRPAFESDIDMLNSYLIIDPKGNVLLSNDNQRSSIPFEELEHMELTDLVDAVKYDERGGHYDW